MLNNILSLIDFGQLAKILKLVNPCYLYYIRYKLYKTVDEGQLNLFYTISI